MAYTSFTITQPFLGAPLQFTPALGSEEFELLIDCYVTGSASKQDKLSQVTIDFYNTATVDLNTGALTKTYNVFPAWGAQSFEQSPTQSQSSGFSPPIYTPSPGSSMTLGDSTYGSISMTPPMRTATASGRITKKAKKEPKKTAEARLPGFSIMTKDGIDVTSSAGRGTKTKEQREHAHLMRQLKACAECKRKKIRCDPSHRRSHNDMSRTSTSSSSSRVNPSPTASTPSTQNAQSAAFNTSNTFEDFILFPDDMDMASWNPADMAMTDFASQDLSQFSFDINDLDINAFAPITPDLDFNNTNTFASYSQQSYSSTNQSQSSNRIPSLSQPSFGIDSQVPGYAPLTSDEYGLDPWAEPQGYGTNVVSHTRSHPASPLNSGQLDGSWNSDLLQGMTDSPSSGSDLPQGENTSSSSNTPSSSYSSHSSSQRLDSSWNTDILPGMGDSMWVVDPSSDQVPLPVSDSSSRIARLDSPANVNAQGASAQSGSDSLQGDGDSGILVDPSDQVPLPSYDSSRMVDINGISFFSRPQILDGHARALQDTIDNVNVARANTQSGQSAMPTALIQSPTCTCVLNTASEQPEAVNVPPQATQSASQEQAQGLGSFNFTEVQIGSNSTTPPFSDGNANLRQVLTQSQSQRDPQSVHRLARQDQPLDSEPEQASMLLQSGPVQISSTMSSTVLLVLNTMLLSGLAILAAFSYFDVVKEWIGGNTESFGLVEVSRLAVCGIAVTFLPELFSGSSTQASGSFGSGFVMAFTLLSFFSGSGLSDSSYISARPPPSKVHSPLKSWTSGTAGTQNFWLRMLEHLSPIQAVA